MIVTFTTPRIKASTENQVSIAYPFGQDTLPMPKASLMQARPAQPKVKTHPFPKKGTTIV